MLTSPVGHVGKREWVTLILNRFSQAGSGCVVITAPLTERLATAPSSTVGTDCSPAVCALRHGAVAAGRSDVAVTEYVYDLAELIHGVFGESSACFWNSEQICAEYQRSAFLIASALRGGSW